MAPIATFDMTVSALKVPSGRPMEHDRPKEGMSCQDRSDAAHLRREEHLAARREKHQADHEHAQHVLAKKRAAQDKKKAKLIEALAAAARRRSSLRRRKVHQAGRHVLHARAVANAHKEYLAQKQVALQGKIKRKLSAAKHRRED